MTWAYCAPEVFKTPPTPDTGEAENSPPKPARSSEVGVQSDMWSVGIVLYVLLSGVHPFDPDGRQTRDQMIINITSGQFSMTGPRWDAISNEAKDLISTLLQVSPEARPTSAKALHHEWFKSQRTSRQSLAVSVSDTEGLQQYRHLMRRKFRTSVVAAVAAETLRRSLKRSRQSTGSVTGNEIGVAVEATSVASSCPSSPATCSTSAAIVAVSGESIDGCHPIASHSVLKQIFHHNDQNEKSSLEVVTATAADADVNDITVNV